MTTITNNPFECGKKLKTGFDYFAKGFCKNELVDAHYRLIADRRQAQLLLECASFEEIDEHYNPGEYDDESGRLTTDMVLEAVRVRQFGQTAKTMAALQRVLNKHLAATGKLVNDEPMFAGEAIIGKPKKSGMFASVTVQFPINDGQTLSIIFHSPDNNKMKITAADEIIAFRWLLNKRDITSAVAPDSAEEGTLPGMAAAKDVSLEEVGIRCAQLISKNSDRFASKSAEIQQAKKELEEIKGQVTGLQDANGQLQQDLAAKVYEDEQTAAKIAATQKQLDAQVNYNDELRSKLDALKATGAGNAGKEHGEDTTGGASKADQEAAEFEAKKAAFEGELKGRGFVGTSTALFKYTAGSGMEIWAHVGQEQKDDDAKITNQVVVTIGKPLQPIDQFKSNKVQIAGLDAQITKALAWIDKKLGEMKKSEPKKPYPGTAIYEELRKIMVGRGFVLNDEAETLTKGDVFTWSKNSMLHKVLVNKHTSRGGYMEIPGSGFSPSGMTAEQIADKIEEVINANMSPSEKSAHTRHINEMKKLADVYRAQGFGEPTHMPTEEEYKAAKLKMKPGNGYTGNAVIPLFYGGVEPEPQAVEPDKAPEPETTNPDAAGDTNPDRAEENAAVTILNDIIAGKYGMDRKKIDALLDEAAATLERLGMMELYDDRLNQAADELTRVLKEAAKGVA